MNTIFRKLNFYLKNIHFKSHLSDLRTALQHNHRHDGIKHWKMYMFESIKCFINYFI